MLDSTKNFQDVVLLSPTGSGKTLGFLFPLLRNLNPKLDTTQALILVPSRELALQIRDVFKSMKTDLKITCCYGGHPIKIELQELEQAPTLLVGTPGRIADHLRRGSLSIDQIETLILDEFDKSLELGFAKEMSFIIDQLEGIQQRILTSATHAVEVPDFVNLNQVSTLDFLEQNTDAQLSVKAIVTKHDQKDATLLQLIHQVGNAPTLVFCNQRAMVEKVGKFLQKAGVFCGMFHGGFTQQERELALIKFKNGSHNILVTTDLAARGLDIDTIQHIVHYQLPHTETELIHRNGRTARMHNNGTAYLLLLEDKKWREYIDDSVEYLELDPQLQPLQLPEWQTLYVSAGKKDKVNKFDIVGTFLKKGQLQKDELGIITVKEHVAYVAVKRHKIKKVIQLLNKQRIKKKKVVVELAR